MKDEDLEQLIGRYRPSAPAAELRARIYEALDPPRVRLGTVDWLCTAAAVVLVAASIVTRVEQPAGATVAEASRRLAVEETAAILGDDATAMALAEAAVPPVPTTADQTTEQPW
jgi:hypothetical protein